MLEPKSHPLNSRLEQLSGYKPSDLKECVEILHDLQSSRRAGNLVAVRKKYNQLKFKCVSGLSSPYVIPSSFFDDILQGTTARRMYELRSSLALATCQPSSITWPWSPD